MSLYSSREDVKQVIEDYTGLQQCRYCNKYFCKLDNIGMWSCKYHPGEIKNGRYTCCGEKRIRPNAYNQYAAHSHYISWGPQNKFDYLPQYSSGCTRRDCVPRHTNKSQTEDVNVEDIASLIPFMKPSLTERPGLVKEPLRLIASQPFPKNMWHCHTGET